MEKKREELVRRLQRMILDPAIFSDNKLPPERNLALDLGVSRSLLREAIITLEALGYIEIRERQGAFIKAPESADFSASMKYATFWPGDLLINLMEMRLLIEPPIAGQAALRRSEEDISRMRSCIAHLAAVQDSPDSGASTGAQWDSMLHMLVVEAAKNPLLTRLYEGMHSTMDNYITISRFKLLALETWPAKILGEHTALVDAIAAKNSEKAIEAQRLHLSSALEKLRGISNSENPEKKTNNPPIKE
ncbi:MAG: FadR/GntR family transcriptional regulator [Spirochaetia bacterium]|jgi:GntR family transcriptional repressor for pyruvate dehydrogenase complex|nr:FadR/GntR family transcriptional regulator [Spirochaetia bacterium]